MDDNKVVKIHEVKDTNKNGIPDDEEMQSCCSGTSDRRFLVFCCQLFITISIVVLCVYKLSTDVGCEESQLYNSLLSVIIGYWMKSLKDH